MTTLTHDECRDALAAHERGGPVERHLGRCEACRGFAEQVDRVDAAAAAIEVPPVTDDLAERVTAAVSAAVAAAPGAARGAASGRVDELGMVRHRRTARRAFLRSGVAAAVAALLVLAGLAIGQGGSEDPGRTALISAARAIEEDGTASVHVEGSVEVAVDRGGGEPDFSELPDEMHVYLEAEWHRMMAEFERSMAEFEERMNRFLDETSRMLDEAVGRFGDPGRPGSGQSPPPPPPAPPRAPAPPEPGPAEPPAPPQRLSLELRLEGTGVVDIDGRVQLEGTLRPVAGTVAVPDHSADFGLAVEGGARVVRGPDGAVAAMPSAEGPLASLLARPDALPRILRSAEGDVTVAGTAEVGGEEVTRYRFRTGERHAEAFLDAGGKLRRLLVHETGSGERQLSWRSTVAVDVTAYGVEVAGSGLTSSAEVTVPPPSGPSMLIYPFGRTVAAALGSRQ